MNATREPIELTALAVEHGYKKCRAAVKETFKDQIWLTSNFPADRKRALDALMTHLIQCMDMLDLVSPDGLPLEVWSEARSDVSDAFDDKCMTEELAALADGCTRFAVPKQFLFDMMTGADSWIRKRSIETWDELMVFAERMGGSALAAAVPIMGFVKQGYEDVALRCGQAIFLTQITANAANNLKLNKNFLALEDLEHCDVDTNRVIMRQHTTELSHFVRLYCSRIEQLFGDAGQLVEYLDFDGARSVKSLLAYHWKVLVNLKYEPALCLARKGPLTKREILALKSRHLLGLEVKLPFLPDEPHH